MCQELFRTVNVKISNIEAQLAKERDLNMRFRKEVADSSMKKDEIEKQKIQLETEYESI